MRVNTMPNSRFVVVLATLLAPHAVAITGLTRADEPSQPAGESDATGVEAYLETLGLGPDVRRELASGGDWSDRKRAVALRLLSRLSTAPRHSMVRWQAAAHAPDAGQGRQGLVRVTGRAVSLMRIPLPESEATIHDRGFFDVIRIVTEQGDSVDVISAGAPGGWQAGGPLDERAEAVGLAVGPGPAWHRPSAAPDASGRPDSAGAAEPAAILIVAASLAWFPATPLGALGMDYALFDGVVDGRGLEPSDANAFYAALAAAGRARPDALAEAAAATTPDILELIDPSRRWVDSHRGEPVALSGVARRATRIAVDSPERRLQLGSDHYWELFVFVETPLLEIDGRVQDSYPVVCCVRSLPEGMPRGEQMTERVDVAGFAFKRYRYRGAEEAIERESPLVIGSRPRWSPAPSPDATDSALGWLLGGLAIVTVVALAGSAWLLSRGSAGDRAGRDHTRGLPERFEPPSAS
jgi:hypothetical protein